MMPLECEKLIALPFPFMTLGQKLQKARDARGWTQEQVGKAVGVSSAAVSQWEGDVTHPRPPKLKVLAKLLEVDHAWLLDGNDDSLASPRDLPPVRPQRLPQGAVPVISYVQAGEWTDVPEAVDVANAERIYTDYPVSVDAFALIVEGYSMLPMLAPGDKIIVEPHLTPAPGTLVVAQLDGDDRATLKRYRDRGKDSDGNPIIELAPINPDYPTLRIDAANPGRIVGVVVERRCYNRPPALDS